MLSKVGSETVLWYIYGDSLLEQNYLMSFTMIFKRFFSIKKGLIKTRSLFWHITL